MATRASKIEIPHSAITVDVSVIDSTAWISDTPHWLSTRPLYAGYELSAGPSYAFYIYHAPSESRLLFDLGVRKNYRSHLSPHLLAELDDIGVQIRVEKDVADILAEHAAAAVGGDGGGTGATCVGDVQPGDIDSIIFSHHHFDHVGDTTKFPGTTRLVVGPGYRATYLPGYPEDPDALETTSDLYAGRGLVELEFNDEDPQTLKIGRFVAHDYFADGSFYLLSTPGHTVGHLSALARTTSDGGGDSSSGEGEQSTFIFLGGDIVHSCAVFRPTEKYPLPDEISPAPNAKPFTTDSTCPGEVFASIHRSRQEEDGESKSRTTPFCLVAGPEADLAESQRSADELANFDGEDNIFTIYAHDDSLCDVLEFFPEKANDWKRKGWDSQGHWRFLAPLMPQEKQGSRL